MFYLARQGVNGPESRRSGAQALLDFDPFDAAVVADPYPWYARLREEAPLYHVARRGYWVLTRYADVREAFRDHQTYSSARGNSPEPGFQPGLIATDPPKHTRLRRIVQAVFTRRAIEEAWGARIRAICEELIRPLLDGAPFDAFRALTLPLPVQVIVEMLGIPDGDLAQFKRWSDLMVEGVSQHLDAEVERRTAESFKALNDYFHAKVRERRTGLGEDLITRVAQAGEGEALTDKEAAHFCILLLIAGNETTTNLLGNALLALMANPAELVKLRARREELLPGAVEEMLRFGPPSKCFFRETTRPIELHGQTIPANARVMLTIAAGNRDPRVFAEPDRFLVDRVCDNDHLSFGSGIHHCLGSMLARLETLTFFDVLLARARDLVPAGEARIVQNPIVRGPDRLPMRLVAA